MTKDSSDKKRRQSAAGILLLGRVVGILISVLVNVVLARSIGAEGLGVFTLVVAWTAIAGLVVTSGLPTLLTREIAANIERRNYPLVKGIIRWSGYLITVLCILALSLGAVLLLLQPDQESRTVLYTVALGVAVVLPLASMLQRISGILRGLDHVVWGTLPEQIFRPAFFLAGLSIGALLSWLTVEHVVVLYIGATVCALGLSHLVLMQKMPPFVQSATPQITNRKWMMALVPLAGIALTATFKHQTDIVMLGFLGTTSDVATYRIASQVAALAGMLMVALNAVYSPKVAALYASQKLGDFHSVLVKSARQMFAAALLTTIIFVLVGKPLLVLVFGPEFEVSYLYAIVLMVGVIISAWCGQTAVVLKMTDHTKVVFRAGIEATAINVILNFVLISTMGPVGAAVATMSALIWVQVRQLLAIRSALQMDISAFGGPMRKEYERDE
ncbi:oligosaccharide flippase family protein [Nereida sp. MMG025]|uniref:oligosaccharide flippase family protein n=1 Tax=Nereida sp. MMG025 TaxID=2909981 RepID=UPI001F00E3A6|nr:oligosaccharide flippase family protein [Nereida sp. MMG025]MCF6445732.1 oligosaccharide flippase family protein [Nereida sp. MMG025]